VLLLGHCKRDGGVQEEPDTSAVKRLFAPTTPNRASFNNAPSNELIAASLARIESRLVTIEDRLASLAALTNAALRGERTESQRGVWHASALVPPAVVSGDGTSTSTPSRRAAARRERTPARSSPRVLVNGADVSLRDDAAHDASLNGNQDDDALFLNDLSPTRKCGCT
jgi:hypothetical protein